MADPAPSTDPQQPPSDPAPTPNNVPPQQTQPDLDEKKFSQREYNAFEANIKRQYQTKSERDKELIEKGKQANIYKMAATAGLDPVLWDRVRGNTDDEIAADIETLKPLSSNGTTPPAGTQQPGGPAPNRQQGTPSQNDGKTGRVADGRSPVKQRAGVTTPSDDAD